MKTKIHSQSGIFNPRILVAFALGSVGVLLAMLSFAAAPALSMPLAPSGLAWSIVTSPNTSATHENVLSGVTCTSASDCWDVGYVYTGFFPPQGAQTLVEHWNGAAWSIVRSPNTSATQDNYLSGVTCTSASDCWAVGDYVIPNGNGFYYSTLVEHWNGAAWSIIPSPNASTRQDNQLRGVTCTSASDCWAVGQYNTDFSSPHTLVEHWNGAAWSIVLTNITQENVPFGVTCTSASDCWAVGYWGTTDNIFHTFAAHWNGAAWSFVTSPNTSTTQPNRLDGVTCSSASDCWAVGGYWDDANVSHTLTEHWNGTAWSIVTSPNTSVTESNRLFGVTCNSASDCWAVGNTFFTNPGGDSVIQTLVEHWNGAAWSIVTSPNHTTPTPYDSLYGVTCTSASDCWAVGASLGENAYQTLIERYSIVPVVPFDFNGDGKTDYVLENVSTRQTALWYLNNNTFLGGASGPTIPAGWSLVDVADFNGDGKPDYALFNPITRQTAIWYMNNNASAGSAGGPTLPSGWSLVATGYFNNDSKPDYVLYNASTRQTAIWYLNNNVLAGGVVGPTLPVGWRLAGVADFNGDGYPDYLLFNSSTRQTAIWYLNNNVLSSGLYGPTLPVGWTVVGVADFNGDGKPDYLLYNASTRQTALWYMHNNVFAGGVFGPTLPVGWSLAAP